MLFFTLQSFLLLCESYTPFVPTNGFTYHIEGVREKAWPSCQYRFLSYPSTCSSVDLWNAAGSNQEWTFIDAGDNKFYLKSSCGSYLSYASDCNNHVVDMWGAAGVNQQFRFVADGVKPFEYYIEAVGRSSCAFKWASFPVSCTTSSSDKIDLWNATGTDQRFRIFPVRSSTIHSVPLNSQVACADPYAWYSDKDNKYYLQCTFDGLALSSSDKMDANAYFSYLGNSLSGTPPVWAQNAGERWAPETITVGSENYLFFGDAQPDGIHRIGWSLSTTGIHSNAWDTYSSTYLNLGNTAGGEIDSTTFQDVDGSHYLVWKSDDNNVGSTVTRIWAQKMLIGNKSVTLVDSPKVIMDSTGLWWIDSWVNGGSLVEGPEVIKRGSYYYLFFASGKYCQNSYAEGVARSTSLWGPYEKMGVPLLSTGSVGYANGKKLIGPGHAAYVKDHISGELFAVYHASIGENCNRYPFIARVVFGSDNWPYIEW